MVRQTFTAGALILGLSAAGVCADPAAPAAGGDQTSVKTSIAKAGQSGGPSAFDAATVNFAKELGASLGYLDSLGHEIFQARKDADPVALALAAQGLAVAEQVAGKKAAITSDQLMKEAAELAQEREYSEELTAVALLVPDSATRDQLNEEAETSRKAEAAAKKALEEGERSRELFGTLEVHNHSSECVNIYVSGRPYGIVHAGQIAHYHVHDHSHVTSLQAYCAEEGEYITGEGIHGHAHYYVWEITD